MLVGPVAEHLVFTCDFAHCQEWSKKVIFLDDSDGQKTKSRTYSTDWLSLFCPWDQANSGHENSK